MEALLADERYQLPRRSVASRPVVEQQQGRRYNHAVGSSRQAVAWSRSASRGQESRLPGASSEWREHVGRHELQQLDAAVASLPQAPALAGPSVVGSSEHVASITDATEDQLDQLRDSSDGDAVVQHLAERYHRGMFYAALGEALIVVNPFTPLPNVAHPGTGFANWAADAIRPHPFATADRTFRAMRCERRARTVVINGVSGSGKSFVCRQMLDQWANLPGNFVVGRRLVHANLLLDQLCNAKTVRNDDGSRISKVIHAHFDRATGHLVGGQFVTMQLDQARLLAPPTSDRNYHIFYQLCFGAGDAERAWLGIGSVKTYRLLNRSSCFQAGVRDEDDHAMTGELMRKAGLRLPEQQNIYTVIAAVLHLGNVEFAIDEDGETTAHSTPQGEAAMLDAARVLGLETSTLAAALCSRQLSTRRSAKAIAYSVNLPREKAEVGRDALVQNMYSVLVEWLNLRLSRGLHTARSAEDAAQSTLSVIDLPGLDSVEHNGFHQLLSNYGFERLATLYAHTQAFSLLSAYDSEGVNRPPGWSETEGGILQQAPELEASGRVTTLIDGLPGGILGTIDREGARPKASDRSLLERLHASHQHKSSVQASDHEIGGTASESGFIYQRPLMSRSSFIITHTAGDINYDVKGFLHENRPVLSPDLAGLLSTSRNVLVAEIGSMLQQRNPNLGGSGISRGVAGVLPSRTSSVGRQYSEGIGALLQAASRTKLVFIACLRPNQLKRSDDFDVSQVAAQLRALGVCGVRKLRAAAWPYSQPFDKFYEQYRKLMPILRALPTTSTQSTSEESSRGAAAQSVATHGTVQAREAAQCLLIILKVSPAEYRLGTHSVFLSAKATMLLQKRVRHVAVILARRAMRLGFPITSSVSRGCRRADIITVQSLFRKQQVQRRFWTFKCAAITIQRSLRRHWRIRAPLAGWEEKLYHSAASQIRNARRQPSRMVESSSLLAERESRLFALDQELSKCQPTQPLHYSSSAPASRDSDGDARLHPVLAVHGQWLASTSARDALLATRQQQSTRIALEALEASSLLSAATREDSSDVSISDAARNTAAVAMQQAGPLPRAAQLDRLIEQQLKESDLHAAAASHFEEAANTKQPETPAELVLAMLQRSIFLKEQARKQLALHENAIKLWSKVGLDLETRAAGKHSHAVRQTTIPEDVAPGTACAGRRPRSTQLLSPSTLSFRNGSTEASSTQDFLRWADSHESRFQSTHYDRRQPEPEPESEPDFELGPALSARRDPQQRYSTELQRGVRVPTNGSRRRGWQDCEHTGMPQVATEPPSARFGLPDGIGGIGAAPAAAAVLDSVAMPTMPDATAPMLPPSALFR